MSKVKQFHLREGTLVEGKSLGCLNVYLASDYDQLKADNEAYKKLHDWLKAENERLARELRLAQMHISAQQWELASAERAANPFHGLYQDVEGKIPVTSAGQLVGRVEYGNGSVGVQFNAANRPTAMPCGDVLIEPGTWLEIDK